jgi:hypothetical protein
MWNMKILLTLATIAFFSVSSRAQEHLPPPEKCHADLAIWYSNVMERDYRNAQTTFIKNGKTDTMPNKSDVAKVPIREVVARLKEMYECAKVVSDDSEPYYRAGAFYSDVFSDRFVDFVDRHELRPQLYEEDDEGKR